MEVEILRKLQKNGNAEVVLQIRESFAFGKNFVIVLELLGPNLYQIMKQRENNKCELSEIQVE
jgi:hypothetical protein